MTTYEDGDIIVCAYRSKGNSKITSVFKHNTYECFSGSDKRWVTWRDMYSVEKYAAAHPHHAIMTLEEAFAERDDFIPGYRNIIWELL